jgi:NADH-quinone oxidoreductase subunit E
MSVRRLAENQPDSFAFTPENQAWADKELKKYPPGRQASAVLPLLWRAQKQNEYWLPRKAIEKVAGMLGLPDIRVLEIATFYTMFNLAPVGRFHVQFCGTTPCMLRGADRLKKVLHRMIGEEDHVSADGTFSWTEVECLGACVNAPMVQINADYYEDLTPETLTRILNDLSAGKKPKPGPQIDRQFSAPAGGENTLTDPALYKTNADATDPRPQ